MTLKLLSHPKGKVNSVFTSIGNNVTTAQCRLLTLRAPVYVIVFLYLFNFMKKKRNFWSPVSLPFYSFSCYFIHYKISLPPSPLCVCACTLHACHCVYTCVHVHSHGAQSRMLGVILYSFLPYFLKRGSHWVRSLLFLLGCWLASSLDPSAFAPWW